MTISGLLKRAADGGRITPDEALLLYTDAPLHALGQAADAVRRLCTAVCDACGRCAADAPPGLVVMRGNLPVIDDVAGAPESPAVTYRCPTGAIRWVVGRQFQEDEVTFASSLEERRAHG